MSTSTGVLSRPSFDGSSLECESSAEVTEIQSDDLPSFKSISTTKSGYQVSDCPFKSFQRIDSDVILQNEVELMTKGKISDLNCKSTESQTVSRQASSETLCNSLNLVDGEDNSNIKQNRDLREVGQAESDVSESLNSSTNDESSSLALLDPKLLASVDSMDVLISNRNNSIESDFAFWSPKKPCQQFDLGFDPPSSQTLEQRNLFVKQYSLYPSDNDNFAPQGSSSPLPFQENESPIVPIIKSPRDGTGLSNELNLSESSSLARKKSFQKLSHDQYVALPSRSGLSTPKSSDVSHDYEEGSEIPQSDVEPGQSSNCVSKIPRYIRKRQKSSGSAQGGTRRKLKNHIPSSPPKADQAAKKLGQTKSHSVSNLSKISVKEYHESSLNHTEQKSFMRRSKKSLSFDSLQPKVSLNSQLNSKDKKSNRFSHVQSKVREYIQGATSLRKKLPSSISESSDIYGRSFVLSPGRKSLSMSNIAHANQSSGKRTSKTDLAKMKSFLSSRNLSGVQVTIFGPRLSQSRESLFQEAQFDSSRISRLLDHLSDENDDELIGDHKRIELKEYDDCSQDGQDVCVFPVGNNLEVDDDEIVLDVEDLLHLALEERRSKEEAKKVLCQLQENYDALQRKFANAENIIDKYRFGGSSNDICHTEHLRSPTEYTSSTTWQQSGVNAENNFTTSMPDNFKSIKDSSHLERLKEILDQLYALELVSSSSNSMITLSEKKKLLDHLKMSFDEIQALSEKDYSSHLTKTSSEVPHDFLIEVGLKLQEMESKLSGQHSFDDNSEEWVVNQIDKFEKESIATKVISNHDQLMENNQNVRVLSSLEDKKTFSDTAKSIQLRLSRSRSLSGEETQAKEDCQKTPQHIHLINEREFVNVDKTIYPQNHDEMSKKMCVEEKVKKWVDLSHLKNGEKRVPSGVKSNLPSCYGSCPTSPTTGSGSREALDQTDRQRKSFDFDSGCPGSDRSTQNLAKRASPNLSAGLSGFLATGSPVTHNGSSRSSKYHLFNVDEGEEKSSNFDSLNCQIYDKSPHNSARSSKGHKSKALSSNLIPKLRLQRDAFHSVTDLSSDEQSNIGLEITENLNSAKISPKSLLIPPLTSPRSNAASQTLTPRGALPILAHQIDQEILELRNLYEGHRQEMFTLLNANEPFVKRSEISATKCTKSYQALGLQSQENTLESESDLCKLSVKEERRLEFQQRRKRLQQRKRQFSQKDRTQETSVPNFVIGTTKPPESLVTKSNGISAFFPNVSDGIDGRRIPALDGEDIFIPKLSLEELGSGESDNYHQVRDQRSFDFGQSLDQAYDGVKCPQQHVSPLSLDFSSTSCGRPKSIALPLIDQCCQVNNNESLLLCENLRRSFSAGHLHNSVSTNRPIIVVQSCCGHSNTTFRSESAHQLRSKEYSSEIKNSTHQFEKSEPSSRKHKRRKKKNASGLLDSLIQANKLAQTLKLKSAEMVEVIEEDIKLLRSLDSCLRDSERND